MKKFFKVILWIFSIGVILGIGGCVASVFVVGKAVKDTATEISSKNKEEKKALKEILKNAPKPVVKRNEFEYTVTYTFKNTSKIDFDYIELDLNVYDKKGTKIDTNMTNITDVKAGQTFKMTVNLYQDGADHYDINSFTNSPLD
ncbi:hypothetical protein HPK19_19495 [Arthrobacter citreus]|nr:hypothetical protein HPK19_19495 [Arthrobacter citreus]